MEAPARGLTGEVLSNDSVEDGNDPRMTFAVITLGSCHLAADLVIRILGVEKFVGDDLDCHYFVVPVVNTPEDAADDRVLHLVSEVGIDLVKDGSDV